MNQYSKSKQYHPTDQGREISLTKLWNVGLKHRFLIIFVTILTTLGAYYYSIVASKIYISEVLMVFDSDNGNGTNNLSNKSVLSSFISIGSGSGSARTEGALAKLRTFPFLKEYIDDENLKPILFADQWDIKENKWLDKEPSDLDSVEFLKSMINSWVHARNAANVTSLTITWKDPSDLDAMANIANSLVKRINLNAKKMEINKANKRIQFLKDELGKTDIVNFQKVLYKMIESQFAKIMIANTNENFIFDVIDPATVPRFPTNQKTQAFIFLGFLSGLFIGLFIAIMVDARLREQV